MKKFLALLLALVMVFALAACGESSDEPSANPNASASTEDLIAELKTVVDGKLTIATSPDFAPYEFYALDDAGNATLAGFDIALGQYLADFMGLECDIIAEDYDGVLADVGAGNVDLALAGLSPTAERALSMDFSDLYYVGGQSFVTTKDKADLFPSLDVLKEHPEYQIGAQNASIQQDLANEYCDPASVVILSKVTDIVADLVHGNLDGAFIETAVANNYAVVNPELAVVLDVPFDTEGSAVGVSKGNAVLLELVNRGIAQCIDDGSMEQFVTEANEQSLGDMYEGLLDSEGHVPEAGTTVEDANPTESAAA